MRTKLWPILLLWAAGSAPAFSQEVSRPWEEYSKLIQSRETVSALGPNLFGDDVGLLDGSLSFSSTDVNVPGNNGLAVSFRRTLNVTNRKGQISDAPLADWDLDLPRLSGVFASTWPSTRCSVTTIAAARPPTVSAGTTYFNAQDYWQGNHANMPGGGEMLLVNASAPKPSTGGPYYWMTSGFTYFSCLASIKNGAGEGFLAITSDGTKYWFDWMAQYVEQNLKGAKPTDGSLPRRKNVIYATRVEDRFGNWVTYTYANASSSPARLTAINASDGRQITVGYNAQGHVATVGNGTQTWTYQYSYPTTTTGTLTAVILPDTSRWTINFAAFSTAKIRYDQGQPGAEDPVRSCSSPGDVITGGAVGTITHPSGATGEFSVEPIRHGRSNVPMVCANYSTPYNDDNDDYAFYPVAYDSFSLTRKRLSGPGLPTADWNYSYYADIYFAPGTGPVCYSGSCIAPVCTSDSCAGSAKTVVTGPGGEWTRYTYGNSYRYNEGKLLKVERGTGPLAISKTVATGYEFGQSGQPFQTPIGTSPQSRGDGFTSEYLRPQRSNTTTLDGATFTWQVNVCGSVYCFDAYARPTSVTKSSSLGYSRSEVTTYADNTAKWVIGQVQSTIVDGIVASEATYDPVTASLLQTKIFGKLKQTLSYNADGTIATVKDGLNQTVTLASWKRGIPQSIQYPDATTQSAIVNDLGWITAVTDENGYVTGYGYDTMGRLASVVYPTSDSVGWNTTTRIFEPVAASEYGIPSGHWRQTTSTGNARSVIYFDALWRPVVTREYDAANVTGTQRFSRHAYDASGHLTFASYPGTTDALTTGTTTTYDALDRVITVSQHSELGTLTTTTDYLAGFQTRVTNPRGFQTTTSYKAYDQPSTDWPVAITHPEGAYTDIVRDSFGKPTSIKRRNAAGTLALIRAYVYDGYQQLCKTIEPETNSAVVAYDAADNLLWSASGLALPSTTACDTSTAYASGRRVDRTYDARNRIKTLVFPDSNGNQTWNYWPDGRPKDITTLNDGGATSVVNAYSYNKRRLLVGESISQSGWYTWSVGYGYDANASLATQTYPSGLSVTYAPNALGQPTQAGSFATAVSYFPNGAIKQFTYGNGIVHTLTQNARQLPDRSLDVYGASPAVLDDSYDYDGNGNVAAISDGLAGARGNRTMTYDGLDRLKTTTSPMYGSSGASYTYDVLDNLTRVNIGGTAARDHYYCYDANWRLTNVKTSSCSGASVIGLGYDIQGNLNNKNGQSYDFDYGNRLRAVTSKESYRYDGLGRRVLAWSPTLGNILSQYSQSGQLLFQEDQRKSPAIGQSYIYLGGSLVAQRDHNYSTGVVTIKYQHTDALGSPVAVTDANRTVLERNEYEPYGKVLAPAAPHDGPGYTGHVYDAVTGMNYMQQRYYDPGIGRFLSVDPVSANGNTGDNFNRYWYANSNPYRFRDPDGRRARPGDRGAAYIGGSISGVDVKSAASVGMANIPRSWLVASLVRNGGLVRVGPPTVNDSDDDPPPERKPGEHVYPNAMSLIAEVGKGMPPVDPNGDGVTDCVELLKVLFKDQGITPATLWIEGRKIGKDTQVAPGTAIATFVNGHYPNNSTGQHAAIYLYQNDSGIVVLDQWGGKPEANQRIIPWNPGEGASRSNNGSSFSTIIW